MMVLTPYGRVFVGVCEPRKTTTEEGLVLEVKGEVAAMCLSSEESDVSLVMCCPSGDWPGGRDLDGMILGVLERAGIERTRFEVREVSPEHFDEDTFRFFKPA